MSSAIAAADAYFPGLPLVGYEHGDGLALAIASGFVTLGALRLVRRILNAPDRGSRARCAP